MSLTRHKLNCVHFKSKCDCYSNSLATHFLIEVTVLKLSSKGSIHYVLVVPPLNKRVIRVLDLIHWTTLPVTSIQAWNISTIPGLEKEERQGGKEERKEKEEGHGGREVEGEWGEKWRKGGEGRGEGKVHESGKERSGGREGGGRRERVEEVEGKEGGGGGGGG